VGRGDLLDHGVDRVLQAACAAAGATPGGSAFAAASSCAWAVVSVLSCAPANGWASGTSAANFAFASLTAAFCCSTGVDGSSFWSATSDWP
jgi:hypothetical protein